MPRASRWLCTTGLKKNLRNSLSLIWIVLKASTAKEFTLPTPRALPKTTVIWLCLFMFGLQIQRQRLGLKARRLVKFLRQVMTVLLPVTSLLCLTQRKLSPPPATLAHTIPTIQTFVTACQPSRRRFRIGWGRPRQGASARLLSRTSSRPSHLPVLLTSEPSTSTATTRCLSMTRSWPRRWAGLPSSQIRAQSLPH